MKTQEKVNQLIIELSKERDTTMKITKTVEKKFGKEFIDFYVDGVLIAKCRKYKEFYCTVKNGQRSNLRDKVKIAKETSWENDGLTTTLLGKDINPRSNKPYYSEVFMNDYPDFKWGYTGSILSPKKIKELFEQYNLLTKNS
jgi:hypothetical protein